MEADRQIYDQKELSYLRQVFLRMHMALEEKQAEQLYCFYRMLTERNQVMNLTAITEFEQVVYKHFLDSLFGVGQMEIRQGVSVMDVGTGAGFPGVPLKICYPQLQVTLLDSLQKRIGFLNEVIDVLGLTGMQTIHGRAEDVGRDVSYREQYDYVVSRAVADLSVLAEYCLPFVKVNGVLLSYKGREVEAELSHAERAIAMLGGKVERTADFSYQVGGEEYHRTIVVIRKTATTPKKYPRKAGTPGKIPLGR